MPFELGQNVKVHPTAEINVEEGFIGDRSIIRAHVRIEGSRIEIGHEAYLDEHAYIGGGSCFDPQAALVIGDFLHMGKRSHINLAEPVTIGHEFGCGIGTKVFAHGAYLPVVEGFPVQWGGVNIGDRVWMPHAWVNPGVTVGNNVVVAAMSLVNRDLPDGCLAAGIPARVIKENVYPKELGMMAKADMLRRIVCRAMEIGSQRGVAQEHKIRLGIITGGTFGVLFDDTLFDVDDRVIAGPCNEMTEILKNQLRRSGIRFRYYGEGGMYKSWTE